MIKRLNQFEYQQTRQQYPQMQGWHCSGPKRTPSCPLLVFVIKEYNLSLQAAPLFRCLCMPVSSKDSSPRGTLA